MKFNTISPDQSISLFVKNIMVFEETENKQQTVLPFFADGYPGLIFQETENGLFVSPQNKQMPTLFLYGQTLMPVELIMQGTYKLIVFQLFPFVLNSFFNVAPKDLNDKCYDLEQLPDDSGIQVIEKMRKTKPRHKRISILSDFLNALFEQKKREIDLNIASAIKKIIRKKGQVSIQELYNELYLTERTFERRFINAVGITAKQFSKIIQFQQSLEQLTVKDYTNLTDIVYANGFADQSHFIKVFKVFTGKTPSAFKSQK